MANKKRSQIDKIKFLDQEIEFLLNQQKYLNASNSLYDFLKVGFGYVESTEFRDSRLAQALSEHLEAVMAGQIKRLIINISPRTMKTLLTGVYFPAYWWLKKPHLKFIYCSYTFDIAKECSEQFRKLVKDDYYKLVQNTMEPLVENPIELTKDTENVIYNNYQGKRYTIGIGGSITGKGADVIILDDPLKASEADSKKMVLKTNRFVGGTLISRFNPSSEEKALIVIQQRLRENDTSGYLIEEIGGFDRLVLPLLYTGVSPSSTKLGFKDWRKNVGEILVPELLDMAAIKRMEVEFTPFEFERQCQQNVKGAAGGIVSNKYFKEYQNAPPYDQYILAADLAESVQDDACFTGLVVFGIYEGRYYVVDVVEKRLGFDDQILEVKKLLTKYPISYKLIEKKSMGAALINVLSKEIPGIIALEPKDYGNEKENRLKATLPAFMAGKIYFPTKESCEKIESLKDQIVTFPLTRYDDVMDAFCYGILWLERNGKIASIEESQVIIPEHIKQRRNIFSDTPPSKIFGSVSKSRFRF
jgi:predicted phage terminase large subunit-like protein